MDDKLPIYLSASSLLLAPIFCGHLYGETLIKAKHCISWFVATCVWFIFVRKILPTQREASESIYMKLSTLWLPLIAVNEMYCLSYGINMDPRGSTQMDMGSITNIGFAFGAASLLAKNQSDKDAEKTVVLLGGITILMCLLFLSPSLPTHTMKNVPLQKIASTYATGVLVLMGILHLHLKMKDVQSVSFHKNS